MFNRKDEAMPMLMGVLAFTGLLLAFVPQRPVEQPTTWIHFSRLTQTLAAEGRVEVEGGEKAVAEIKERLQKAGFRIDD